MAEAAALSGERVIPADEPDEAYERMLAARAEEDEAAREENENEADGGEAEETDSGTRLRSRR
eukprot:6699494-Prymnesium_polylepis.1